MGFKKLRKRRGNSDVLKQWHQTRKEASQSELNGSNIEPRQTRLQTKLINPVAASMKVKEQPKQIETEMPKKKRHLPVRKYSGKTIVIDDEAKEEEPTNSKAKTPAKSSELVETLQLFFWTEDLSPAQIEVRDKREQEYAELINKLESLAKQNGGESVYQGDGCSAYQYNVSPPALPSVPQSNGVSEAYTSQNLTTIAQNNMMLSTKGNAPPNTYQLVMDPRLGLIVGTMTPASQTVVNSVSSASMTGSTQPAVATVTPQMRSTPQKRTRGRPLGGSTATGHPMHPNPPPLQALQQQFGNHPQPSTSSANPPSQRAAESTAVGGLATGSTHTKAPAAIVDLTSDDGRPPPDSREVAFNKLQGKTFPSLVVVARPHLHAKEAASANDRSILDTKVKSVLVHTPTKFTEWLIQQGLVRSEQHCSMHPTNKLNLGMYSDVSKFPYSGGYVWISECCPHRFVSVFSGSLFEGATHPPTVLLKLIYHWACQTNIQNVVQWVKVDNLYVKGLFTWLRAICTYALQQHLKPLGGPGKKIEVGVISLGTTSQDGSQRQVKVEVLGILDPELRLVRLRAVEPLADGERNYKRRFSKILEPLRTWVHPDSTISTDLTVDKGTLHVMGFSNVLQNTQSGIAGNQGIMEYLRKIVPRMFQNTLSLLSRQIIQQFLDELVWREWYGQTAAQAFNNMVNHAAEQTRLSISESLIVRLNKVAANPFKNYTLLYQSNTGPKIEPPPGIKRYYGRKRPAPPLLPAAVGEPDRIKKINLGPEVVDTTSNTDSMVPLESYYYGYMEGDQSNPLAQKVILNVRCCVCKVPYSNNIELLDHLLAHAHNMSAKSALTQCRYCLASLPTLDELNKHIENLHPVETRSFGNTHPACILCEQRFSSIYMLGKHMSKEHVPQELPYQCGTCQFRCSSHRHAIDHFYTQHDGATTVQCPFCLKCTAVWSSGRIMSTNVTFFLAHLQKHQRKTMAKKCYNCALWFIQKDTLKEHQQKAHVSFFGKRGVEPWQLPANFVMVPKSKLYHRPIKTFPIPIPIPLQPEVSNIHKLDLIIPPNVQCKECHKFVTDADHYPQKLSCSSCRYVTDCAHSMQMHKNKCRKSPVPVIPRFSLPYELFCVCGYASDCGNQMAKHLALCERRTAYPTTEMAQAAGSDTHSMLDVLGLVRKNDDVSQVIPIEIDSEKLDDPSVDDSNVEEVTEKEEETPMDISLDTSAIEKDAIETADNIEIMETSDLKLETRHTENGDDAKRADAEEPKVVETEVEAAEVIQIESEIVPAEAGTTEAVPNEAEAAIVVPNEAETAEVEAAEIVPNEAETAEVVPDEDEAAEVLPSETEAPEVLPTETEAAEVLPTETEAAEVLPTETRTADVLLNEATTTKIQPTAAAVVSADVEADEDLPADAESAEVLRSEDEAAEILSTDADTSEALPTEAETIEDLQTEAETNEVLPTEAETAHVQNEAESTEVAQTKTEVEIVPSEDEVVSTAVQSAEVAQSEAESAEVIPTDTVQAESTEVVQPDILHAETGEAQVLQTEAEPADVVQTEIEQAEVVQTE